MKTHLFGLSVVFLILGCELIPEAMDPPPNEIVIMKNIRQQDTLAYDLDSLFINLVSDSEAPVMISNSDTSKVLIISIDKEQILFFGKAVGSTVIKFHVSGKSTLSILYFDLTVDPCPVELLDCLGKCNGTAEIDSCGVCNGDDDCDCPGYPDGTVKDCNGECGGVAYLDECNVCDNDPINDCLQDCSGIWGGSSEIDSCGICDDNQANNCQETKAVLVEVFTNDGCTPCVPVNHLLDELFEEHNENITMVRYHWNSPNPGDPMYHYNSEDVELRIQMYSVLFCPVVVVNGMYVSNGQGPIESNVNGNIYTELANESILYMGHDTDTSLDNDSIYVALEILPFEIINGPVKSWAVVVEDSIYHEGFNGETIHMQVMRDLGVGEEWSALESDSLYSTSISLSKPEGYSDENTLFHIVTMIQNTETNQVIQSNRLHAPPY